MSRFIQKFQRSDIKKRLAESNRVLSEHPERCCVIVARDDNSTLPQIDKHKYLVPNTISVSQFSYIIRKRIKLSPEEAMFLFVNKTLPSASETIERLYHQHKDEDGFLYITYASENTFG